MKKPPAFLLVENVKGFEDSMTREKYITFLKKNNYLYQEFLLTPLQFGMPNSRLRYYCLAKHFPTEGYFAFPHYPEKVRCYTCCLTSRVTSFWYLSSIKSSRLFFITKPSQKYKCWVVVEKKWLMLNSCWGHWIHPHRLVFSVQVLLYETNNSAISCLLCVN